MLRNLALGLAACFLAGCSTANYPALYTAPATSEGQSASAILEQARTVQESYAASYLKLSKRNDLLNVPLIGVAAAGAALLFAKADADLIFGLGLGAAVYSQGRARFEPASLAGLYIDGHEALGCVRRSGEIFAAADAATKRDAFAFAAETLAAQRLEAEIVSMQTLPAGTPASQASVFQAAQLRLRDQITEAKAAEAEASRELSAFAGAPQVLSAAVDKVQRTVATRGRAGRNVDVRDLTQTLLSEGKSWTAPRAAADTSVPVAVSDDEGEDAKPGTPTEALRALFAATRRVQTLSPQFAAALGRLNACPMVGP